MEIIIVWFLLSLVIASAASNRGRSGFSWFLVSVVFSPLIAGIAVLMLGQETKHCIKCNGRIQSDMTICNFCGEKQDKE